MKTFNSFLGILGTIQSVFKRTLILLYPCLLTLYSGLQWLFIYVSENKVSVRVDKLLKGEEKVVKILFTKVLYHPNLWEAFQTQLRKDWDMNSLCSLNIQSWCESNEIEVVQISSFCIFKLDVLFHYKASFRTDISCSWCLNFSKSTTA